MSHAAKDVKRALAGAAAGWRAKGAWKCDNQCVSWLCSAGQPRQLKVPTRSCVPQRRQFAVQPETGWPGLRATDDSLRLGLLLLDPRQKICRLKRMLRLGPVHHADHYNAGRVGIHRPRRRSGLILGLR
jgi:hypothetical protein